MQKRLELIIFFVVAFTSIMVTADELKISCAGKYKHHLQGICSNGESVFWSFTTTLVKTDLKGRVLKSIPVVNHHGDLCFHDGKLFVAVNLGEFNNPKGKADSWVYVYDAKDLSEISKIETQQVIYGAGGIGVRDNQFYVVGGLPADIDENYVYQFDKNWKFIKRHKVASGQTHLGIQTATYSSGKWYFGCYGSPAELLVTDEKFKMLGKFNYNCSLGIESWKNGQLLAASGRCDKTAGCDGTIRTVRPDAKLGLMPAK